MTIGLSHPLWSLSNRTADGIHQGKKSTKHVGEPVWILACRLIYLNLPAFLGTKIQEYVMRAFPCPSCDLYKWADRGKSQNEVDILPLQGSALSETAVSFDRGVAIWKLGHISQERRARVGCWKEPRAGVSDAPGSNDDCLSFPVGPSVHSPPPHVGFLICKVRRLLSKVFFSTVCVRLCAFTENLYYLMYLFDSLSWTSELFKSKTFEARPVFLTTTLYYWVLYTEVPSAGILCSVWLSSTYIY